VDSKSGCAILVAPSCRWGPGVTGGIERRRDDKDRSYPGGDFQAIAAAYAATGAGGGGARYPVMITGMRQVGSVNFDLLVEFELTVTPEGMPPYPATTEQLVSQFQVSQIQVGRTVTATIDPSNPAAFWLDFATVREV
jgi:hypothetical protein